MDVVVTPVSPGVATIRVTAVESSSSGRTERLSVEFEVEVTEEVATEEIVMAVDDESTTEIIQVYPNPVVKSYTIRLPNVYGNVSVQLRSATGQLLETKVYEQTSFIQSDMDVPAGIYLLDVWVNGIKRATKRISKQ